MRGHVETDYGRECVRRRPCARLLLPWDFHCEHRKGSAVREERHAAVVVERDDEIPEIGGGFWQLRRPSVMTIRQRLGRCGILNALSMRRERGAVGTDIEA